MTDLTKLTQDLMDSQRFTTLLVALGNGWKKRALTDDDRARLLEPILALIVAKVDAQDAPTPEEMRKGMLSPERDKVKDTPEFRKRQLEAMNALRVSLGGFAESEAAQAELGFDPFSHPESREPNPVSVREQQLVGMKSVLEAAQMVPGQNKMVMFPMDWNANDAPVFFSALNGEYILGPKGVQLGTAVDEIGGVDVNAPRGALGWRVDVIRQR